MKVVSERGARKIIERRGTKWAMKESSEGSETNTNVVKGEGNIRKKG